MLQHMCASLLRRSASQSGAEEEQGSGYLPFLENSWGRQAVQYTCTVVSILDLHTSDACC